MGWILSSLDEVWKQILGDKQPLEESPFKGHLPLAMMPLGTGNDLSRSFGWGPTFSNSMRKQGMIDKVVQATPQPLDRWRAVVVPFKSLSTDARKWVPAMLGEKMRNRCDELCMNLILFFRLKIRSNSLTPIFNCRLSLRSSLQDGKYPRPPDSLHR